MKRWIGHYRCCRCGHEWREPAGPVECHACGHLYIDWLNYEALVRRRALQGDQT